jgi:hypothetical protein
MASIETSAVKFPSVVMRRINCIRPGCRRGPARLGLEVTGRIGSSDAVYRSSLARMTATRPRLGHRYKCLAFLVSFGLCTDVVGRTEEGCRRGPARLGLEVTGRIGSSDAVYRTLQPAV